MTISETVSAGQLRAFIERIERLEEEKRAIADDIKEVKAEAKGSGFDVATINAIVKLRKKDPAERDEAQAMLDMYKSALGMLPLVEPEAGRSYAEEKGRGLALGNSEVHSGQAEITDDEQPGTAIQSVQSHDAAVASAPAESASGEISAQNARRPSINDEPYPEAGPQTEASLAGTGSGTSAGREGRHEGEAASADLPTHSHSPAPHAQAPQADTTDEAVKSSAASSVPHYEGA